MATKSRKSKERVPKIVNSKVIIGGKKYCIDGKTRHKVGNKTTGYLPWKDAMTLLTHLRRFDPHLAVMFHLGLRLGWRGSDLAVLKWKHVKSLEHIKIIETKTQKQQKTKMHDKLVAHLREESENQLGCLYGMTDDDYLYHEPVASPFAKRKQVGKGDFRCVRQMEDDIRRVLKELFPNWYEGQIAVGWHTVRKTGARHIYENILGQIDNGTIPHNVSAIDIVSTLLNHTSIVQTRRYIGLTDEICDWAVTLDDYDDYE